ncbi:MAG: TonB-dependent siderophore receptor [Geitlerinemataceae cyanobacterium]
MRLPWPLTADGSVRYRLNALYRTEDYHRDYNTDVERVFIAPVIAIDIDDDTDLILELEYSDDKRPNDFGLVAIGDEVIDVPFDRALSNPDEAAETESLRLGYRLEHRFDEDWKLRNSLVYNRYDSEIFIDLAPQLVGFGLLPTAFNEDTGDVFFYPASLNQPASNLDLQTNVVGEFNTGSIEHTLLAGVDFFTFWDRGNESRSVFPPDPSLIGSLNLFNPDYSGLSTPDFDDSFAEVLGGSGRTSNLGVYVQDQVKLLDNLILLAGIRFDTVYQENTSRFLGRATETEREESDWTPRAGLVYQPSEDLSLYASYGRSFTPNFATQANGSFIEAERGEQFEIGARAELLDDNLYINLALFNIDKENVAITDPNNPAFSIASEAQRSRGIELDIIGEILPGWNIVANYALLDTEITDDDDPNSGNSLLNAPENVANLWTTYEFQSGALEGLMLGAGFNYVSERFGDLANSFSVDDYFLTNAVIAYDKDNWRAAVNFRNIFDIDYIETAGNSRARGIHAGQGFTVIGSFSIEF